MSHRRAVLDHVLRLVAGSPCGDELVLRGSMTMLAFAPEAARDPGDLDWVLRPRQGVPVDDLHPYPYVDRLAAAQWWPEAAHGALGGGMWEHDGEFDTGGLHPRVPPDGLHWVAAPDADEPPAHHAEVLTLIERHPEVGPVRLDPDGCRTDERGEYVEYLGTPGARLVVPWHAGDESGEVQLDFAYDEPLPRTPVLLAVPRRSGPPTPVWAASLEVSLAWKLKWLHTDQRDRGVGRHKDLYDAVLLAESPDAVLSHGLLRTVLGADCPDDALRSSAVNRWTIEGGTDPGPLLGRLSVALDRLLRTGGSTTRKQTSASVQPKTHPAP